MSIFSLCLLIILGLSAEHYFPHWAELTGHKLPSPIRLIVNYAAGSVIWFGAFTAWLVLNGFSRIAVIGWLFALVAGMTVIILYVVDSYITKKTELADSREINDLLERQKNASKRS